VIVIDIAPRSFTTSENQTTFEKKPPARAGGFVFVITRKST
jgi:hypothetical protein